MSTLVAECPFCGSDQTRPAQSKGVFQYVLEGIGMFPYRCEECQKKFRFRLWGARDLFYAKCPRCYRQDLSMWEMKYYRPRYRTRLKLTLGARPLRCESCRCNFASWLPRKNRYRKRTFVNPVLKRVDRGSAKGGDPAGPADSA
jgi:hypothetical protein